MTYTKETDTKNTANLSENHPKTETKFAGLSVVLHPTETSSTPIPLTEWLADSSLESDTTPIWIPLRRVDGVVKVMPVLPEPQLYPSLMQAICQQIGQDSLIEWQQKPYEIAGVEVDSHSLHTIQATISAVKPLPPTLGRAIHGLCFRWFANTSPQLAESLHQQENLPMALGLEYCSPKKMLLKISLLQKELLAPLLWGMNADLGNEITLAGIPCQLGSWIDISQASSFEKMVQVPTQNLINLQFLSPTSFKQGKNIQPFPLPELVFNGLLRRWNLFAPEKLHFPNVEWSGVVSAYELKTYAMKMEGGAEIGAEGLVRYRFADAEQAKIATILANFACFAGIGRKTTMGMGQVCMKS
ncbi:MAG: CRISPR system precrRNA processing endoribonuclease RAMP protein Cas6 [Cyanomargarita calcarea GSE-NOS-MK-12-04C]|jgi:CRISPR-associated endoribonuclease Cas6|uniref:CRISPR system precrRNA processing endoribonuclease RAMP protein Cas6 n=1 Tax=Cyanomargarita calcarea GSE-NOS-MK-12-04C TaxID=2839659 RepID=A0A951UWN2_9CYAN|nr:CRISPR system precrRNA processing endoribonuclease RAMP protein Cas6 [Cyanomargarita calcarea GSE-NOS-MK-12-04C]